MTNQKSRLGLLFEDFVQNNSEYVLGIACVGNDGMLVDSYVRTDVKPDHAAIISATLFNFVNRISKTLSMGSMQEIMIRSETGYVLIMPVNNDQMLVVLLNNEANMGLMQFEIRSLIEHITND